MKKENNVPIWEKYALTVDEAAAYFNIGNKKLRQMIIESIDSNYQFAIQNGTKYLVNRKKFEKYLDTVTSI